MEVVSIEVREAVVDNLLTQRVKRLLTTQYINVSDVILQCSHGELDIEIPIMNIK